MGRRLELQAILENILESNNVYFQPPATVKLSYPCILYERTSSDTKFADNRQYLFKHRYKITYIDRSPDNDKIMALSELPLCVYDRFYVSDGLNHDVFNIYY